MSDFFARHAEMQPPEPAVSGGVDIVRADAARSARSAAQRSGDHAAVERYDAEERQALGGADEGGGAVVEAGEVAEDGAPDASVYGIAASRFEQADAGSYYDLVLDWGPPDSREFRESFDLARQLAHELAAGDPGLDAAIADAGLASHPSIARALGRIARKLQKAGQSAEPSNRGTRTMQNSKPSSVADEIDQVRAERKLAHAQGDYRKVAELDEQERQLWSQTEGGSGPVVGSRLRNY